ncbi:hypothetical protein [Streptomyces griseoaurantiacus]|uniref:hypothetical protein n=1 Tax=Streptomyces griseoaurantiacus TaxID=68213 RepID=UPI0036A3CFA8
MHTLVWGECEYAAEPEPTVSLSRVYVDTDGHKSICFDTFTVPELARLVEPAAGDALRAVAVARAIVYRDAAAAPAAAPAPPPSEEEAVAALAPLEAAVRAGREVQQTGGRAALRDRIAAALMGLGHPQWDAAEGADAVLTVLSEPTDQAAAELASLAVNAGRALQDEKRHYQIACEENARLRAEVERLRADQAAVRATTPTAPGVKHMLARMRADAATHDIDHLLQLLARWATSSEGRNGPLDDLVAAGYRLPHACGNCEGVDPATCLANPEAPAGPAAPVEEEGR